MRNLVAARDEELLVNRTFQAYFGIFHALLKSWSMYRSVWSLVCLEARGMKTIMLRRRMSHLFICRLRAVFSCVCSLILSSHIHTAFLTPSPPVTVSPAAPTTIWPFANTQPQNQLSTAAYESPVKLNQVPNT